MQQSISSTTQNENKAKEREREREKKKKTSSPENTILLDSGTEMQKRKQIQTQN